MKQNPLSKIAFAALLLATFTFTACWASLDLRIVDSFNFSKSSSTIQNLDTNNFQGTAFSSDWSSTQEYTTYSIRAVAIWLNECTHFYGLAHGSYGWVIDGDQLDYPLHWDLDGNTQEAQIEIGYIYNVCNRFDFIPHIGYSYEKINSKFKHQKEIKPNPSSFSDRNGNKTHQWLFAPYIGLELAFQPTFCNCFKVEISAKYELYYGYGRGRTTVREFFVTDDPNTSLYGNHVKFRDIISHEIGLYIGHKFSDCFKAYLEFDYVNTYNTHNLPVKLQHNKQIVASGQFTPSQYHVMSDYNYETYSIRLGLSYTFGATKDSGYATPF